MNPKHYLIYQILAVCHIRVQCHAQDGTLWLLTNNDSPYEPMNAPMLIACVKLALQLAINTTKDPFLDMELITSQANGLDQDSIIVKIQG